MFFFDSAFIVYGYKYIKTYSIYNRNMYEYKTIEEFRKDGYQCILSGNSYIMIPPVHDVFHVYMITHYS